MYKEIHSGPLPKSYAHIDFRIALAKEIIGTFSMRQSTPLSKPLYVGPSSPDEQFMSHQNRKIDPPTLRVCRPHKKNIMGLQSAQFMVVKFAQSQFANNTI